MRFLTDKRAERNVIVGAPRDLEYVDALEEHTVWSMSKAKG